MASKNREDVGEYTVRRSVYDSIYYIPRTATEIAVLLNVPINQVTPRIFELRQAKKIKYAGKRKCEVTGRRVNTWIVRY